MKKKENEESMEALLTYIAIIFIAGMVGIGVSTLLSYVREDVKALLISISAASVSCLILLLYLRIRLLEKDKN